MNMKKFDRAASSSSSWESSSTSTGETWFVAVSREVKESESVLRWALENLRSGGGTEICLLHIHRPGKKIPAGVTWLPVELASEDQINYHRAIEREKLSEKMNKYLQICMQHPYRVKAKKIYVEMESIEEGIVKLLNENGVGKLVMGAASEKNYRKGMIEISSEKAKYVSKHAPGHCRIWFVCKKLLIYTREATVPLEQNQVPDNQSWALPPPGEISRSSSARSSFGEPEMLYSSNPSAPHLAPSKDDGRSKVDIWNLMAKVDNLEAENAKISRELQDVRYKKFALDGRIEKYVLKVKELEQNLASAMQLAEDYKKERDEMMQRERDNSIRWVEEVRIQLNEGASSIDFLQFCSEFSSREIQSATKNFDPSLKTGEDVYGNIYNGFLHLTEVAVKIPHPDNPLVPQEFRQEVEILCKLRHPNIVNLIGICPESHALIYEHYVNRTLEDQLNNKDQGSPFPWQICVRIATELCAVLAFLHSLKPNPVIHGGLRPENIHLDSNYACKLTGFRISSAVLKGESSLEKKPSFYRSDSVARSYPYTDPEFFLGGDLTTGSDVYALGIILMQLLTGKPAARLLRLVQNAVKNDEVSGLLEDSSDGWPLDKAKLLVDLALRCCEMAQDQRPDLKEDVWKVLESLKE